MLLVVNGKRLRRSNLFNLELEEEDEAAVDSCFAVIIVVVIPRGVPVNLALLQVSDSIILIYWSFFLFNII